MISRDSDMGKIIFIYIAFLCCFFSFTEAMFFTNSKDNDYPRIGKRPLPSSVYKTWLSKNEQIEYLPYVLDSSGAKDRRQGTFHWTNDITRMPIGLRKICTRNQTRLWLAPQVIEIYDNSDTCDFNDITESSRASVQVTGEIVDRNLYRMLMSYLESDDDLNF